MREYVPSDWYAVHDEQGREPWNAPQNWGLSCVIQSTMASTSLLSTICIHSYLLTQTTFIIQMLSFPYYALIHSKGIIFSCFSLWASHCHFFLWFQLGIPKRRPFSSYSGTIPSPTARLHFLILILNRNEASLMAIAATVCAQYVILVRVAWLLSFYSSKLDLHNFPIYITYLYLNVSVVVILDFLRYWLYQFTFYPPFTVYICMHI